MRPQKTLRHLASSRPIDSETGYLTSVSDLTIGVLFILLILITLISITNVTIKKNYDNEIERIKIRLADAQSEIASIPRPTPQPLPKEPPKVTASPDPRGRVTESIGQKLKELVPTIEVHPATGVITLPEDMLFPSGRHELTQQGASALTELTAVLAQILPCYVANSQKKCVENPEEHAIDTIFVEGHTDSVPLLTPKYDNTNLSFDRARSVYRILTQKNNDAGLFDLKNENQQSIFSMSGYADTRPIPGLDGFSAKNRRVDLRIVLTYKKND